MTIHEKKLLLQFLEEKEQEYARQGYIPTLDILVEELKAELGTDND